MQFFKSLSQARVDVSRRVYIYLPIDLIERIEALAKSEGMRPTDLLPLLVEDGLLAWENQTNHAEVWQMLTARQKEVAELLLINYSNKEIGAQLDIRPNTVKSHVKRILATFEVANAGQLRELFANVDVATFVASDGDELLLLKQF